MLLNNITKYYGDKKVLDNFSCEIVDNEITIIKAVSGYGKTTLLHILAGIESYSGMIITNTSSVSIVFQDNRFCENLSAIENCMIANCDMNKAKELLRLMQIDDDTANIPLKKYSIGMQKRVMVARCLSSNAQLLLLDEPFTALDENNRQLIIEAIKQYRDNRTTIIVTHTDEDKFFNGSNVIEL